MVKIKIKKSKFVSNILSIFLTLIVIGIYLIPNFGYAVNVDLTTNQASYLSTEIIEVDLTVTIDQDERIPIRDLVLRSNDVEICKFDVDGTLLTACTGITISPILTGNDGTGSLNGTGSGFNESGPATDQFTDFSYGYGYGYGINLGYTGNLTYTVTWDRTAYQTVAGENNLELYVGAENDVNSFTYAGEITFDLDSVVDLANNSFNVNSILGTNPSFNSITSKLNLIKLGNYSTKIVWSTTNASLVNVNTGEITRPTNDADNVPVTLTATFSKSGHVSATKNIDIVVLKETESDETAVAEQTKILDFSLIKLLNPHEGNISSNLNLSTKGILGTSVSWSSSDSTIIDTDGSVSRASTNTTVSLTATVSKGLATNSTTFSLIVPGTADPDELDLAQAKRDLTDSIILNGNSAKDNILSGVYLPATINNIPITWSSSNLAAIYANGTVTRSTTSDQEVMLIATLTKNTKTTTKNILLTVKMRMAPAVADSSGNVNLSSGENEIVIDDSNAAAISSISVPSTVDEDAIITLNLATLKSENNVTIGNSLNLSRATSTVNYEIIIPAGTTMTGDDNWNGLINLPSVKDVSEVSITQETNKEKTVDVVIELGAINQLNFTNPVKITLPGMTGKKAAFTTGTDLTEIITICNSATDASNIVGVRECYFDDGTDLIIWTMHFTKFAAFTETDTTPVPPTDGDTGGGGGGGGGPFHRWVCNEWSECTADGQTRTCDYTGTYTIPNTNPNDLEQDCEYTAEEEEEEVLPEEEEEIAPTTPPIIGAVIGAAETAVQSIWSKIIGGIIGVFVVTYLLYTIVIRSGATLQLVKRDHNWYYNRATLLHRKGDELYRKGKRSKAEKLFKKAQIYRETGEHKQN